jgi:hypothetical protein
MKNPGFGRDFCLCIREMREKRICRSLSADARATGVAAMTSAVIAAPRAGSFRACPAAWVARSC